MPLAALALQDEHLVTKREYFQFEVGATPNDVTDGGEKGDEDSAHRAILAAAAYRGEMLSDSITHGIFGRDSYATAAMLAAQYKYLVAQRQQLEFQISSSANQVTNGAEQRDENGIHPSDSDSEPRHGETLADSAMYGIFGRDSGLSEQNPC